MTWRGLRERYFGITESYVNAVLRITCPKCFLRASMMVSVIETSAANPLTAADTEPSAADPMTAADSEPSAAGPASRSSLPVHGRNKLSSVRNLAGISRFFILKMTDLAQFLLPWHVAVLFHEPTKLTMLGHAGYGSPDPTLIQEFFTNQVHEQLFRVYLEFIMYFEMVILNIITINYHHQLS